MLRNYLKKLTFQQCGYSFKSQICIIPLNDFLTMSEEKLAYYWVISVNINRVSLIDPGSTCRVHRMWFISPDLLERFMNSEKTQSRKLLSSQIRSGVVACRELIGYLKPRDFLGHLMPGRKKNLHWNVRRKAQRYNCYLKKNSIA